MLADARDTASLCLLADQLDALDECLMVAGLATGGVAADLTQHGEHPSIAGAAERIRRHLEHARGSVGAATGLLGSLMAARERAHAAPEPAPAGLDRPERPEGPVCTCGHILAVHDGPQGWCVAPSPCECPVFHDDRLVP